MDEDATNSNDFDGNDDHDNNETTATAAANRGSTEAGAMRGVARSLQNAGQRMVQFPVVGRLPAPRPTITTTTTTTTIQWKIPNLGLGKPSNLPKMRNHVPKPRMPGGAATATGSATATASSTAVRAGRSMPRPPPPPPPPKSIPVRQVAKLSDRVSTGLEVFDTAQETGVVSTRLSQSRVVSFGMTMVKNTLLGAAVFETYCYTVESLAPAAGPGPAAPAKSDDNHNHSDNDVENTTPSASASSSLTDDAYSRASPALHIMAGALGGGVHGIVGTLWEFVAAASKSFSSRSSSTPTATTTTTTATLRTILTTTLPRMTLHHGMAHAALFGSYEITKRQLLHHLYDYNNHTNTTTTTTTAAAPPPQAHPATAHTTSSSQSLLHAGLAYLGSVLVAGGVAGQVQHVASHYTEQWLRLEEGAMATTSTTRNVWKVRPPLLRSVLMAFPASSIGFVAFEYGRSIS